MLGEASPAEAASTGPTSEILAPEGTSVAPTEGPAQVSGDEAEEPASCELYKARDMCCPIWCAGKDKSGGFEAAKALSRCARGYGCDWSGSTAHASFQCGDKCK